MAEVLRAGGREEGPRGDAKSTSPGGRGLCTQSPCRPRCDGECASVCGQRCRPGAADLVAADLMAADPEAADRGFLLTPIGGRLTPPLLGPTAS